MLFSWYYTAINRIDIIGTYIDCNASVSYIKRGKK